MKLVSKVTPKFCAFLSLLFPWAGLASGCAVRNVTNPEVTITNPGSIAPIRAILRHGDWIVTRGIHKSDNVVASVTNMPLSHAAIYDARHDEVIESEANGVHVTPLVEFLAKSQRVLIMRPMWATSPAVAAGAVDRARDLIGKGYNFTGLVGLNMPDRYYCTELAVAAYEPFMLDKPDNPIPRIIMPGQMYHWGRILYDSGPLSKQ